MNPAQHEVLTLHHDVLARLAPADNILESKTFLASIGKAERMMAQLPGLSHVVGGFSMRELLRLCHSRPKERQELSTQL